jgi:GAF domain-containing protein
MEASYCIIVKRQRAPLVIANAKEDPRADGHPAQNTVLAYCGFPLTDEAGKVYGTMCHFDLVPRPKDHEPLELMEVMADLLRESHGLRKPA